MFGRKKNTVSGTVDTLIGKSAVVKGDMEFSGGLHLDGRIVGNVCAAAPATGKASSSSTTTLWISEDGSIDGNVDVPSLVLNGIVRGDIRASSRVVIGAKAKVFGNVHYGVIEMTQGGEVNGKLIPSHVGTLNAVPSSPAQESTLVNFDGRKSGT